MICSVISGISDIAVGLVIFLIWLILMAIVARLPRSYSHYQAFNNFITFYVIGAVLFLIYLVVTNIQIPYFLGIFVLLLIATSFLTARYMLSSYPIPSDGEPATRLEATESQLRYLSRHRNVVVILNFFLPILIYTAAFAVKFVIEAESVRQLLSDIFLVFSGLLILIVTFYIFIFERKLHQTQVEATIHQKIADLLIQRVTILGALYVFTILISVASLMSIKDVPLVFLSSEAVTSSLFALVIYFASYALILTIIVFYQIVGVYRYELPVSTASQSIDVVEQIKKLGELKEHGLVTEQEFQKKKRELLSEK
jgi:Short C-terminal domain